MEPAVEVEKSAEGMEDTEGQPKDLDAARQERGAEAGKNPSLGEIGALDPEVSAKAFRRRYSAEYKLKILKQADTLSRHEFGTLLRREGLYRTNLITWRKQRKRGELEGLSPRKRGRKPNPNTQLLQKCARLELEKERLERKIEQMETIIEFQKKMADLLKRSEETQEE